MPPRPAAVHHTSPPKSWPPSQATFLIRPCLSPTFPPSLLPFLYHPPKPSPVTFAPHPVPHPAQVTIKKLSDPSHPASGQYGLFARTKLRGGTLVIPYLGLIHAACEGEAAEHEDSDYDLSLVRIPASHPLNPKPGKHISIGVDAALAGNAGRFVNDYRGVQSGPNAEFRVGQGGAGEVRMEIWTLKCGISKGEEVLVSYGKGWWAARRGA